MLFKKSLRVFVLVLSQLAFAAAVEAQAPVVSSVRIDTSPSGLQFYVDGQLFHGSATLLWPQGSKHSVTTDPVPNSGVSKTQFAFSGWTTNLGVPADMMAITADPGLTWILGTFTTEYAVDVNF